MNKTKKKGEGKEKEERNEQVVTDLPLWTGSAKGLNYGGKFRFELPNYMAGRGMEGKKKKEEEKEEKERKKRSFGGKSCSQTAC